MGHTLLHTSLILGCTLIFSALKSILLYSNINICDYYHVIILLYWHIRILLYALGGNIGIASLVRSAALPNERKNLRGVYVYH